jgi:hypothetical protein
MGQPQSQSDGLKICASRYWRGFYPVGKSVWDGIAHFERGQDRGDHFAALEWIDKTAQIDGAADDFAEFEFGQCVESTEGLIELMEEDQQARQPQIVGMQERIRRPLATNMVKKNIVKGRSTNAGIWFSHDGLSGLS